MRVLIVDDIVDNRRLLRDILKKHGECEMASGGKEAVEIFSMDFEDGNPFDLVLLDIMMPDVDGQEALRLMRQFEQDNGVKPEDATPIIMVTAVDAKVEVEEAMAGGCTDYINKPISTGKLMIKLSEIGLVPADWWEKKE
jgi:two-component system, chemotaxis family, chemotaxis protein CheY